MTILDLSVFLQAEERRGTQSALADARRAVSATPAFPTALSSRRRAGRADEWDGRGDKALGEKALGEKALGGKALGEEALGEKAPGGVG